MKRYDNEFEALVKNDLTIFFLDQIIYVHAAENDFHAKTLKKQFPDIVELKNDLPLDICDQLAPRHSILILDDQELSLATDKKKSKHC